MARAEANPAAKNYGTNIVGIAAEQFDYFTPVVTSVTPTPTTTEPSDLATTKQPGDFGLYPNIIEFRPPYSLTPVKQFYPVERYKGNPSPDPSIPGMQMGAGEIHFYLDATSAGFWLKHLLQATEVYSFAFGLYEIIPSHDFTGGALVAATITDDKQPKGLLAAVAAPTIHASEHSSSTPYAPKPPETMTAARINFSQAGTYVIDGRDHNGAPVNETRTVSGSGGVSRHYYERIENISSESASANACVVSASVTDVYEHTLSFVSEVSEGLTLEVREGNIDTPITYNGLLVSRGILTLEDVSRFRALVIANEAHPRQAMHGGVDGSVTSNLKRLDFHAIPAPGMSWEISGDNVPADYQGTFRVASIGMAIDNRIAPPRTAYAETFFYPKPVRKMNRELQLQVAIDYSKEADFDRFVGGFTFESTLSAVSKPFGGAYRGIKVKGNQCQIVNNPTRIAGDLGEVLQQIVTRMHIGDNEDGNDEAEITIINTEMRF